MSTTLSIFVQLSSFLIQNAASQFNYPQPLPFPNPILQRYIPPPPPLTPPSMMGYQYSHSRISKRRKKSKHYHDSVYYDDSDYHQYSKARNKKIYSEDSSDSSNFEDDCRCSCQACVTEPKICCQTMCEACGYPSNQGVVLVPYPYPMILSAVNSNNKSTTQEGKTKLKEKTTAKPKKLKGKHRNLEHMEKNLNNGDINMSTSSKSTRKTRTTSTKTTTISTTSKTEIPEVEVTPKNQKESAVSAYILTEQISKSFAPAKSRLRPNNIHEIEDPLLSRHRQNSIVNGIIIKTPKTNRRSQQEVVTVLRSGKEDLPKYGIIPISGKLAKNLMMQLRSVKPIRRTNVKEEDHYNAIKYHRERAIKDALRYYKFRGMNDYTLRNRY